MNSIFGSFFRFVALAGAAANGRPGAGAVKKGAAPQH